MLGFKLIHVSKIQVSLILHTSDQKGINKPLNWVINGPQNGLEPWQYQAITWTNADSLSI